ncbi:MAG: hypothetical protein KC933_29205 [Myxococcales bacterium]|nr:hypothetical protein [Myxococcales bacterium]
MFASFARIVRAYRLYNADNATVVRMIDELWRGFGDVLEVTPELVITVQANALLLGEASLLETADTDESIPFALYRDGIRRIEFLHGLPRDELEALVEATSLGLGFTGVGDDVVSLLWRRDLRHISYVVVDTTIVESDGRVATEHGDASTVDAQINALLANLYGHSDDVEGRLSLHLDGADLPAKRVAEALDDVDDMAAGGRPVRHLGQRAAYQDDLEREVAEEGDFAISVRGLEGALRSLAQPLPPAEARTMADALLRMLDTALLEDRFQVATGIVSGVRRSGQSRALVGGWMDEVVSEARTRHVAAAFNNPQATEEVRATALEYFRACGAWVVEPLLGLLPGIVDAQLRRAVSTLLLEIGIIDPAPVKALLQNEQAFVAQEAVYLLVHMGRDTDHEALFAAAHHVSPQVRITVAEHLGQLPEQLGRDLAAQLTADVELRVQVAGIRGLARYPGQSALAVVEGLVTRTALEGKHFEYKRAALESYAALGQTRAVQVLHRYIRDGDGFLTGREAEETAVAAALALGRIRSMASVEILRRGAMSRNKRLRETARRSLIQMKERA